MDSRDRTPRGWSGYRPRPRSLSPAPRSVTRHVTLCSVNWAPRGGSTTWEPVSWELSRKTHRGGRCTCPHRMLLLLKPPWLMSEHSVHIHSLPPSCVQPTGSCWWPSGLGANSGAKSRPGPHPHSGQFLVGQTHMPANKKLYGLWQRMWGQGANL